MKDYLEMFMSFFKIGTFTIGGGYAMVPLIETEVVEKKKWLQKEEFVDMLALAQSAPGVLAVNMAVFVGYKRAGILGSIITTIGAILPAFLVVILIAIFFMDIKDSPTVERVFTGIRPAVAALIAVTVIKFGKSAKINKKTFIIPVIVTVIVAYLKITAVIIIIAAATLGILFKRLGRKKQ